MSGCVISKVRVSQNDCFMELKLSVFAVYWVSVIALSHPTRGQPVQDVATRNKKFDDVFIICYTKKLLTDLKLTWPTTDPSIVGHHVQPLKRIISRHVFLCKFQVLRIKLDLIISFKFW